MTPPPSHQLANVSHCRGYTSEARPLADADRDCVRFAARSDERLCRRRPSRSPRAIPRFRRSDPGEAFCQFRVSSEHALRKDLVPAPPEPAGAVTGSALGAMTGLAESSQVIHTRGAEATVRVEHAPMNGTPRPERGDHHDERRQDEEYGNHHGRLADQNARRRRWRPECAAACEYNGAEHRISRSESLRHHHHADDQRRALMAPHPSHHPAQPSHRRGYPNEKPAPLSDAGRDCV